MRSFLLSWSNSAVIFGLIFAEKIILILHRKLASVSGAGSGELIGFQFSAEMLIGGLAILLLEKISKSKAKEKR